MSFNDRPIHLSDLKICKKEPHSEPSVTVPVWITQSNLDGLQAVIRVIEGMERSGQGRISGSFELTMFYRQLCSAISKAEQQVEDAAQ